MTGFGAFLRKEFREIWRTWRLWVFPAVVLFFAISGPILAKAMKALLQSQAGQLGLQIPDPTYVDSYTSWAKNLGQLGVLALVIIYGGLVNGELRQNTAALVLTKPVSRPAFVLAKVCATVVATTAALVVGGLVEWGLTRAIFGHAPITPLVDATASFLLLAVLLLAVTTFFSAWFGAAAAASGASFGVYILLTVATLWGPAARLSPAGLIGLPGTFAAEKPALWGWPSLTGVMFAAAFVAGAVAVFRRREL